VLNGALQHNLLTVSVALRAEATELDRGLSKLGICLERSDYQVALSCRGVPGAEILPLDAALVSVQPYRSFPPGLVVAWADDEGVLRYGLIMDDSKGQGPTEAPYHLLRALLVKVSNTEVRRMISSDIMCFKSTTNHANAKHTPPPAALSASTFDASVNVNGGRAALGKETRGSGPVEVRSGGGGAAAGNRGDGVAPREIADAVERLLSRLDIPLSLEKKELLASVIALKEDLSTASSELKQTKQKALILESRHSRLRESCMCPITQEVMVDPVVASDGHVYERSAILRCIQAGQPSPLTRQVLSPDLATSHAHKVMCRAFANE
jgi:hypothetical protein